MCERASCRAELRTGSDAVLEFVRAGRRRLVEAGRSAGANKEGGRPKRALGREERQFIFLRIIGQRQPGRAAPLFEPPAVSHQPEKVQRDRESANEDRSEDDQLPARPFHKAPQVLFPNACNPFPSKVEGSKLAFCDPIVDGPPRDAQLPADLLDGIHPLHALDSPQPA